MNPKDKKAAFFGASIDPHIDSIDLHATHSVDEAITKLEKELYKISQKENTRYCRVIHGIGEGILASAVQKYLRKHPMVESLKQEENGGSCIVLF